MTQRTIFTSTPRKRTYLWDTGQTILQTQKSQAKTLSDVNTAASRVYRVVLWESQDISSSSKKNKRSGSTSKKKQKENKFFNGSNSDKNNSLKFSHSGVCLNDKKEPGDNLVDQKENEEEKLQNETQYGKRAKYKFQVNKEIQRLFSKKFSDKRKNPNHLKKMNTLEFSSQENDSKKTCSVASQDQTNNKADKSEHSDQNKPQIYPQRISAVLNSCNDYCNKKLGKISVKSNHNNEVRKCDPNGKCIRRDTQMNDKNKWEDEIFFKSSGHLIDNSNGRLENKNNIGYLGNNNDCSSQNEANMFDIWSLSRDIGHENDHHFDNWDSITGQTSSQQLKKKGFNEKVNITKTVDIKKKDYSNFSKNKDLKINDALVENSLSENKCHFQTKHSRSVKAMAPCVGTPQIAQNSKKFQSSNVHSSKVYEFPNSPNTGIIQPSTKGKKRSLQMKKNLKNDLAVDQILKTISKTKMEMQSIREKMLKKKNHK